MIQGYWKTFFINLIFLPVSVDGGWSPWGNWTRCSKTCGVGYQTQHRTCTNPPPQHGGKDCQGNLDQSRQCEDQKHCPSEFDSQSQFEYSWLAIIGLGFRMIWRIIMQIVERVIGQGGENREKVGKFRQRNILQITVVIRWVAFLLFLLRWGSNLPTDVFFAKRVKCSAIFACSTKKSNLFRRGSRLACFFFCRLFCTIDVILSNIANV